MQVISMLFHSAIMWVNLKQKKEIHLLLLSYTFPIILFCKLLCACISQKHMFVCNIVLISIFTAKFTQALRTFPKIYGCFLKCMSESRMMNTSRMNFITVHIVTDSILAENAFFSPKINQWQMSSMYLKYLNKKMQNKSYSEKNGYSVHLFQINPTFFYGSWTLKSLES